MGSVFMLYASGTGNTELMAEAMVAHLESKNYTVVTKAFDFDPIDVEELLEYDAVLIGTHTRNDGELPYEAEDFYEELEDVPITGKVFGVFGSADSFYDIYGGAADLMTSRLQNLGGKLVSGSLKVDLVPDAEDIKQCEQFADKLLELIEE